MFVTPVTFAFGGTNSSAYICEELVLLPELLSALIEEHKLAIKRVGNSGGAARAVT